MSKDKKKKSKDKGSSVFNSMADLQKRKKEIDREIAKQVIRCAHTTEKGKPDVSVIKGNLVRCNRCEHVFSLKMISASELEDAVRVIDNAVNQMKIMSDDPTGKDSHTMKDLGTIAYNAGEVDKLYARTVRKCGKNNGKNKNKNKDKGKNNTDDFGSFGGSLKFI